jgi:hypothetical protein
LSNEEKTNDYENFEKGMIYMEILKKGDTQQKNNNYKKPVKSVASLELEC